MRAAARHSLRFEQWVPYPVARVFAFFADPANLPPLMPRWQRAIIETASLVAPPERPAEHADTHAAGAGSRMLISFRPVPLVPLRIRWDASIVAFTWDDHFCDEQRSGPFAYWLHCHRLRAEARDRAGGTLVVDEVTYAMRFGPLGELANRLGGAQQMRSLFRYRQRKLLELLAAA